MGWVRPGFQIMTGSLVHAAQQGQEREREGGGTQNWYHICRVCVPEPEYTQLYSVKGSRTAIVFSPAASWLTAVVTGLQDPADWHRV